VEAARAAKPAIEKQSRKARKAACRAASDARRSGRPIATADAWNAATALLLGLPLVTHNRSHFAHVAGLTIISEAP